MEPLKFSSANTLDALAAAALAGLVWESVKAYRAAAPSLADLRDCSANDPRVLQRLVDADITIGIPTVIAGLVASLFLRSVWPLVIVLLAYGATVGYHHSILSEHGPTTKGNE